MKGLSKRDMHTLNEQRRRDSIKVTNLYLHITCMLHACYMHSIKYYEHVLKKYYPWETYIILSKCQVAIIIIRPHWHVYTGPGKRDLYTSVWLSFTIPIIYPFAKH